MAEIRINATGGVKFYDADDSHYAQIVAGTITSNTDVMTLGHAAVVMGTKLDMNGSNLVLDADADTYLDTGTDDTIKVYVSGAHDLTIGANAINVLSGTTLTIDSGATITNSGTANGFGGADPSSADGDTLGTASAEWSDLYLADGGIVYFGNDQDIKLTHNADKGLILKHAATADDKPVILTLQTGETDMAQDDVMGKIEFQAPDEGTGTDAILVAAAIQAVAEGDFSSSSNATRLEFMTGSSEAATSQMSISSGGIVGIGTVPTGDLGVGLHIKSADSSADVHTNADELVLENSGDCGITILSNTSDYGNIYFGDSGDNNIGQIGYNHNTNDMQFHTNASEAMRINSDGSVAIGSTSSTYGLNVVNDTTSYVCQFENSSSGVIYGIKMNFKGNDPDGNTRHAYIFSGGTGGSEVARAIMYPDGDWVNHDNSYGSLSDERIKQNITDANSQWDDIKALRVRNFKKKDDVRKYGEAAWEQIGLIAQETELVSPKLIKECEPNAADIQSSSEFGTLYTEQDNLDGLIPEDKVVGNIKEIKDNVKKISYSVLYMKAIKALQEAQTRIETLETEMTALKARVTTLEG